MITTISQGSRPETSQSEDITPTDMISVCKTQRSFLEFFSSNLGQTAKEFLRTEPKGRFAITDEITVFQNGMLASASREPLSVVIARWNRTNPHRSLLSVFCSKFENHVLEVAFGKKK